MGHILLIVLSGGLQSNISVFYIRYIRSNFKHVFWRRVVLLQVSVSWIYGVLCNRWVAKG